MTELTGKAAAEYIPLVKEEEEEVSTRQVQRVSDGRPLTKLL